MTGATLVQKLMSHHLQHEYRADVHHAATVLTIAARTWAPLGFPDQLPPHLAGGLTLDEAAREAQAMLEPGHSIGFEPSQVLAGLELHMVGTALAYARGQASLSDLQQSCLAYYHSVKR